jgi:hypothetical protein
MKDIRMLQEGPLDVAAASDGRLVLLTPIRFKRSSGRAHDAAATGARARPPLARHAGVGRGQIAQGNRGAGETR